MSYGPYLEKTKRRYLIGWANKISNQNQTFIYHYQGQDIATLALNHENGWVIEVTISRNNIKNPTWRDRDNCYDNIDDAKSAGVTWAKARIDENAANGAPIKT